MSNLKLLSEVSLPQSHQAPEIYVQNWTNLAMPSRMRVDHRTLTPSYGRFTIEPLEQGYAVTLGHSLRKTLLASMNGSAIVAVKMRETAFKNIIRTLDPGTANLNRGKDNPNAIREISGNDPGTDPLKRL